MYVRAYERAGPGDTAFYKMLVIIVIGNSACMTLLVVFKQDRFE